MKCIFEYFTEVQQENIGSNGKQAPAELSDFVNLLKHNFFRTPRDDY